MACDYIDKHLTDYKRPFIYVMACGCLAEGTPVKLWSGGIKNVEDIRSGDVLMSYNGDRLMPNVVDDVVMSMNNPKPMLELEYDGEKITTTYDHPFWAGDGYYPLYQLVWGTLETSQRVQLKLLCEQYGQAFDDKTIWFKTHSHNEAFVRREWVLQDNDGRAYYKGSPNCRGELVGEPIKLASNKPYQLRQDGQQGRELGVGDEEIQCLVWSKTGVNDTTTRPKKTNYERTVQKDLQQVSRTVGWEGETKKRGETKDYRYDTQRDETGNIGLSDIQTRKWNIKVLEAEPYYSIGMRGAPYSYCIGREHCFITHNTGKSLVIAELAKRWGRVLVITMSAELCRQDLDEMKEYGVDAVAYSASLNQKAIGNITVATIGSAYKNPWLFSDADIVVIDEVQSVNCADRDSMFMKLLIEMNKIKRENGGRIKVVGLTATAYRNVQKVKNMGRYYETTTMLQPLNRIPMGRGFLWSTIQEGITTKQALELGYLTPVQYYCQPQGGKLKVNSTGAEFTDDSLDDWGDGVVERCCSVMKGCEDKWNIKSGIVALPFVRHAEALKTLCDKQGMSTVVVSAKTPQKARKEAIRAFKAGEIRWLLQCNIANVGFNSPITDTLIWARPTLSLNLWQQAVGRVMRLSEGKEVARVLDLVGTMETFGKVEDVHLGKEDKFKTTIAGSRGQLSGIPLKKFHWSRNLTNQDDI